jgi:nucleotide-binding universal stress UspA family protein
MGKRILVPVNGSEQVHEAFEFVAEAVVRRSPVHVTVVR